MSPPRCVACGGHRITPPTYMPAHASQVQLQYAHLDGGFFDQGLRLPVEGRACLDCGYVMLFLTADALATARAQPAFKPWGS
jgi:hypothetical protein